MVDVIDIASDTGLSGVWTGSHPGTIGSEQLPAQCAANVEYDIARRYRGGKPRMFLPPPSLNETASPSKFTDSYLTGLGNQFPLFFAAISGVTVGATVVTAHVNVSYYQGFTNVTNSSGRTRAAPKYRTAALVDVIEGYAPKALIGSQKRRRAATTP
jgi:hypothetical protein